MRVNPPDGVGAITGTLFPELGDPIALSQAVGPPGGPVPLTDVDGQMATVCGRAQVVDGVLRLQVTRVIPQRAPAALILVVLLAVALLAARN